MEAEAYYYHRDSGWNPVVTVCLLKDDGGNIGKGVAVCSSLESPCKRRGRQIARGRAMQALTRKDTVLPIMRHDALWVLNDTDFYTPVNGRHKAMFNPSLTDFEKKILNMNEKEKTPNVF